MGYFIFKGVSSRDYGILERIPDIIKPRQKTKAITIPGRAEPFFKTTPEFDPITVTMTLGIKDKSKISEIYSWLHGEGDLTLGSDTAKYYKAHCYMDIQPQYLSKRFCKLPIRFVCEPFLYSLIKEPVTLTEPSTIDNPGTIYSAPQITIYGSGNIELYVNGETLQLKDVDGYVTVDSELMLVYKGQENRLHKSIGFLPMLNTGTNYIAWDGDVTSATISPNWRWI